MDPLDSLNLTYLTLRGAQVAACLALAVMAVRRLLAPAEPTGYLAPPTARRGFGLGTLLLLAAALLSLFDLWDNLLNRPHDPLVTSSWVWLAFDLLFPVVGFLLLKAQAERDEALARLAQLAATDALTGLLNRRGFLDAAAGRIAVARRAGQRLAVVAFDLDRFKSINDLHGHAAGDAVLRGAAQAVRGTLRGGDLAGRIGGEEFCLLLDPADPSTALACAERLRAAMAGIPHPHPGGRVSASFGVAVVGAPGATPLVALEGAMVAADAALYRAKAAGRDRVESALPALVAAT